MRNIVIWLLIAAFLIAGGISFFASTAPDGLEKVAKDKGFIEKVEGTGKGVPVMPDYTIPGIKHRFASGAFAGIIGTGVVFGLTLAIGKILRIKRRKQAEERRA